MTNVQRIDRLCNYYLKLRRSSVDRAAFSDALARTARYLIESFTAR